MAAMFVAFVLLTDNMDAITAAVQQSGNGQADRSQGRSTQESSEDYGAGDDSVLVIEADSRGHYYLTAEIGGRDIDFLVDTGATLVALTSEDAESIGFPIHQLEYSGRTNTANGQIRTARLLIEEISIDGNSVRNVQGSVSDAPLHISLLGMSFLRKLSGFEVRDDKLILRW